MPGKKKKKKKEPYDQKTAKLTPEEQAMRRENLIARQNMDEDAVRQLCAAICVGSICDYKKKTKQLAILKEPWAGVKPRLIPKSVKEKIEEVKEEILEIEDFFESEMFVHCTGMENPKETIEHIRRVPRSYMTLLERRAN